MELEAIGVAIDEVQRLRRRVVTDGLAISFSAAAFAIVHGLASRQAGFSFIEAMAMSAIVLAGAARFAALGLVTAIGMQPSLGVLVGGLGGPLIAMALPDRSGVTGTSRGAAA